ncbi:LecA/PA-IL family lectin [Chelativorans salis]|uniref:LecA/PA-IL family lectin n=1 Tax=Chelativorans salis TaxID=2978478 RepID=A0ABT2LTU7_9HYPH|nr:LecA/PA-IL family lectin [Chelativorans sp. EGI FJ00035]MCT7377965.1 LecA/PA-IL family lectin [Chelativorans sp. EGI FJ00035]
MWHGKLDPKSENGKATSVHLKEDDVITITVTGSARNGPAAPEEGPDGDPQNKDPKAILPGTNVGAVLMRVGKDGAPKVIGTGKSNWGVGEVGEITFLYNDVPGEYGNNSGSFDVTITRERGQGHYDTIINYVTQDNTTWTARWVGDIFLHTPAGPRQGGTEHKDKIIIYKTWDNSAWQASWDPTTKKFDHVPLPTANPPSRVQHEDANLNYITWNGDKWTAVRDGDGFYHTPA